MSLIGCVDTLTDTRISGWAADDADANKLVRVDIVVNSQCIATIPGDAFRDDLRIAGIGDGRKGFSFDPSAHLKPGRNRLEVRYADSGGVMPKGVGSWVKRREGELAEAEIAIVAALEAYHEFTPADHVCGIGKGAAELERCLLVAGMPLGKFAKLETPCDLAVPGQTQDVDVIVAWESTSLDAIPVLCRLAQDRLRCPGLLAIGFADPLSGAAEIRQAFEECGVPDVQFESIPSAEGGGYQMFAFVQLGETETHAVVAAPVLVHIHVPKCAGTSLRVLLETHFGPRYLGLYVNDTYFVYGEEALRSYLLQDSTIWGISSHHVRRFPRWIGGREMLYVTFLRNPIQQFISYVTHIEKHYSRITAQTLLEAVPPNAPRLTSREFAAWLLTQDRDVPFRENHNVNFFARHNAPGAIDRLEAAKAALSGFFFVGIAERMEESISKLRALTREAGLEFPPSPIPFENTSADYRDNLSWINADDAIGSLLLQSVEKDRQLYDWAMSRL